MTHPLTAGFNTTHHADGRIFVSATHLNDRCWIRPSPGNFRTHAEHIDEFLDILKDLIAPR